MSGRLMEGNDPGREEVVEMKDRIEKSEHRV